MNTPLVSICIPTYNGQEYLSQCIESAIIQSYKNIEILIVDDNSSDNTHQIVETYRSKDNRIRFVQNEKNLGLVGNWNKCIDEAKGEWIKFLFQDDYMDTNCIQVMVESISADDRLITSGRRLVFDPGLDEKVKQYSISQTLTFERLGIPSSAHSTISSETISDFAVQHICMNFIGEPTVIMFRKDVVSELGYFNPELSQICDFEYFLRISSRYGLKNIPQPLTWFRVHRKSTSSSQMKEKLFILTHLDPIIMVYKILYDAKYGTLRKALSLFQTFKLKTYLNIHTYEAGKAALGGGNESIVLLENLCNKYPELKHLVKGNIMTKVVLFFLKLKRG
jgi:glycosyltransferase involved in cell wall biosynthesis